MGADGAQDDPVTGSRSLVSRRNVLRAAGAAGAAVWVAPVVESFTSYAVAGSAPTTQTDLTFGCSWVYVVWENSQGVQYTGWQTNTSGTSTVCNADADYPSSTSVSTPSCSGTTYTLKKDTSIPGPPPMISYSGLRNGSQTATTNGCSYFTYSGTSGDFTINATHSSKITILAAFYSKANNVKGICASTSTSVTINVT